MSRGSASVLAIGLVGVSAMLVTATGAVGHAVALKAGLDGAADAAALAAADAVAGFVSNEPCSVAQRAAALNGAHLAACTIDGAVADVLVDATVFGVRASSRARAGPPAG
jgi:secretion/DNA translocation related TadE-like protein